ncbi:MAG: hypothetical protein WA459_18605 [Stellaceae bacterium]
MRTVLIVSLVALLGLSAALAQTTPAPSPAPATPSSAPVRGGDVTRDQFIERALERARRAAEKRFDQLDTNHDGILSAEERQAARAARAQQRAAPPQ